MVISLVTIVVMFVGLLIFFLITSIIIREIGEFVLKIPDSTFHKSSEIAAALTALIFLQFLVGNIVILQVLILVAFIELLYMMGKHIYELKRKQAVIMTACVIGVWIVVILFLGFIMYLFPLSGIN